jgi:7-cyano-7-deazaguanine reductase
MAQTLDSPETKHLGRISNDPQDALDCLPWCFGDIAINLVCSEFTSQCPVTGQPDYATLEISYTPGEWFVETKSLKLWLWSFRGKKAFNEAITAEIAEAFAAQVKPLEVTVVMHFHQRGGIAVRAMSTRRTE